MNAKELIKQLEAHGYYRKSQSGSHIKMINGNKTLTVPDYGKKDIGIGLLKAIEHQSGVKLR
ncbi:MAG: type II toxin-antitoxin system HicA family toxin [Campylobacterales bacterium]|nr:type II toxin-antitoxin system HicA family toxin [Campylobacterales bacterium]